MALGKKNIFNRPKRKKNTSVISCTPQSLFRFLLLMVSTIHTIATGVKYNKIRRIEINISRIGQRERRVSSVVYERVNNAFWRHFLMEDTVMFVDDGFFGLVKKHLQKKTGRDKKYLQTFRNICKKENNEREKKI